MAPALPLEEKVKDLQLPAGSNYLLDMMKALNKDQATESEKQVEDADSTMLSVKIESNMYNHWNGVLKYWAGQVYDNAGNATKRAQDQSQYQEYSAEAQSQQSQQDGAVQANQGQTSADATNLQMKAQMVQGINSILSTLVNLLGRITS